MDEEQSALGRELIAVHHAAGHILRADHHFAHDTGPVRQCDRLRIQRVDTFRFVGTAVEKPENQSKEQRTAPGPVK